MKETKTEDLRVTDLQRRLLEAQMENNAKDATLRVLRSAVDDLCIAEDDRRKRWEAMRTMLLFAFFFFAAVFVVTMCYAAEGRVSILDAVMALLSSAAFGGVLCKGYTDNWDESPEESEEQIYE